MCYIKKTISVKILVICVINSSRHRKCFILTGLYSLVVFVIIIIIKSL